MERPRNQCQFTKPIKLAARGHPHNRGQFAKTIKLPKGRRRGPGSMPALVEPPRGPVPLSGGAEAPLDFD